MASTYMQEHDMLFRCKLVINAGCSAVDDPVLTSEIQYQNYYTKIAEIQPKFITSEQRTNMFRLGLL